jgi:hypothetical protein
LIEILLKSNIIKPIQIILRLFKQRAPAARRARHLTHISGQLPNHQIIEHADRIIIILEKIGRSVLASNALPFDRRADDIETPGEQPLPGLPKKSK